MDILEKIGEGFSNFIDWIWEEEPEAEAEPPPQPEDSHYGPVIKYNAELIKDNFYQADLIEKKCLCSSPNAQELRIRARILMDINEILIERDLPADATAEETVRWLHPRDSKWVTWVKLPK